MSKFDIIRYIWNELSNFDKGTILSIPLVIVEVIFACVLYFGDYHPYRSVCIWGVLFVIIAIILYYFIKSDITTIRDHFIYTSNVVMHAILIFAVGDIVFDINKAYREFETRNPELREYSDVLYRHPLEILTIYEENPDISVIDLIEKLNSK